MTQNFEAINLALTAGMAWAAWQFALKPLFLSEARQNLFRMRDDLFIEAAKGDNGLSLDLPAYREVRSQFNRNIRLCHRMTSVMFVCAVAISAMPRGRSTTEVAMDAMAEGPAKDRLKAVQHVMFREMLNYLLKTSPFFLLVCLLLGLSSLLIGLVRRNVATFKAETNAFAVRFEAPLRTLDARALSIC